MRIIHDYLCTRCNGSISGIPQEIKRSFIIDSDGNNIYCHPECKKLNKQDGLCCDVSFCVNMKAGHGNYCVKHQTMVIKLIDYNREMAAALKPYFENIPNVETIGDSAFNHPTECIISPANSFGFMDGGFDATITNYLGPQVQENVQRKICDEYNGELLVGQAFYVETGNPLIPYCICAPTMRVPMYLGGESTNTYLAARAIFILLRQPNLPFRTVTIPGLGTGVGAVPYDTCAKQMYQAYRDFYLQESVFPASWHQAQLKHQLLYSQQTRDIQFEK